MTDWINYLNIFSAIITILIAINFLFKKAIDRYKQEMARINKGFKLRRIKNLRKQYFISKDIEGSVSLLISYTARNIAVIIMLCMMMVFIGFVFLFLNDEILKLFGTLYIVFILMFSFVHIDKFINVLIGLNNPTDFRRKLKVSLNELR